MGTSVEKKKHADITMMAPSSSMGAVAVVVLSWVSGTCFARDGTCHGECTDGEGTLILPNGDEYTGFFEDGQFSSRGEYVGRSGMMYSGDWVSGKEDGKGKKKYPDGSEYDGDWARGQRHGRGKWSGNLMGDDASYDGSWMEDDRHGYGKYTVQGRFAYDGMWQYGVQQGYGERTEYKSGEVYKGEWVNNIEHGYGILLFEGLTNDDANTSNNKYEGHFEMGVRSGAGTIAKPDGSIYKGAVVRGVQQGYGTTTYPNGGTYNGEWVRGMRVGFGVYEETDPRTAYSYAGQWKEDRMHGRGIHNDDVAHVRYIGDFKFGVRHGHGTEERHDTGGTYKGPWKDGKKNGSGHESARTGGESEDPIVVVYRKGVVQTRMDDSYVQSRIGGGNPKKKRHQDTMDRAATKSAMLEARRADDAADKAAEIVARHADKRKALHEVPSAEIQHNEF